MDLLENGSDYEMGDIFFGTGVDVFSMGANSCYLWQQSAFPNQQNSFQSRSSSVKVIITSNSWNNADFFAQLQTVKSQIDLTFSAGKFLIHV